MTTGRINQIAPFTVTDGMRTDAGATRQKWAAATEVRCYTNTRPPDDCYTLSLTLQRVTYRSRTRSDALTAYAVTDTPPPVKEAKPRDPIAHSTALARTCFPLADCPAHREGGSHHETTGRT